MTDTGDTTDTTGRNVVTGNGTPREPEEEVTHEREQDTARMPYDVRHDPTGRPVIIMHTDGVPLTDMLASHIEGDTRVGVTISGITQDTHESILEWYATATIHHDGRTPPTITHRPCDAPTADALIIDVLHRIADHILHEYQEGKGTSP